jgi:hypothetical protein
MVLKRRRKEGEPHEGTIDDLNRRRHCFGRCPSIRVPTRDPAQGPKVERER